MGTVKSLKFFTLIGSFRQNYISSKSTLKSCFGKKKKKKNTEGLSLVTPKSDANFK